MSKYKRYERYKDSGVEWIGEIPEHWEIKKLKYICSESAVYGLNESAENYAEEGVRFIRTTDIDDKGNLDSNEEGVFLPEEKTKGYILKTGDLLVSRSGSLGTSLYFDENKYGKCSYAGYLVKFRANSKNHPKFLFYFSKSNIFYIQIQMALVSSTISNFNGNKYANMILTLSSYNEQKTIANFLDQKTAEIDDLIADKEKLIELLQEKRQAIITEAVTKGLNPSVKMKDSGIEWIGEIPEHWEIRKLKYLGEAIIGLTYSPEEIADEGVLVLRASNIKNNKIVFDDNVYVNKKVPKKLITRHGDILICSRSGSRELIGKNACIDENSEGFTFGAFMTVFRSKYWRYLYYVFNSTLFKYQSGSFLTSTINQLTINNLNSFIVPLPPENEQKHICDILDKKVENIDTLITEIQNQIQKLKEYRKSLISEAVTGKIDVREFGNMSEVIYYEQNNSPCSKFTHIAE